MPLLTNRGAPNIPISFPAKSLDPYPVGLKVVDQSLIWYPSLKSPAKPMTVGDYVQLTDTEIHFNAPDENENRWRSLLEASFDIPLWAVRDAPPTKDHYPVLIYAPSDSSVSWGNADCVSTLPVMATSFLRVRRWECRRGT